MSGGDGLPGLDRRHVWHPFTQAATAPLAVEVTSAEGAWLTATDGKRYLDLISSWWVILHGHGEPAIADAIAAQARALDHVIFAGFTHEPAVRLATDLATMLPGDLNRVFFSDNGSTAVEVALKIARQYFRNRGEEARRRYLSLEGGYHGDTFGAMAVGASSGFYAAWEDMLMEVATVPFPETWQGDNGAEEKEAAALAQLDVYLAAHGDETAAMILEPLVQGASGFRMCRPEFLRALVGRLKEAGILVIFDEVMTGFGRTGELFACVKADTVPDMICLSKGLTGGFLPLAATVCRDEIHDAFMGDGFDKAFAHGHSYSANPLGCAAANASIALLRTPKTQARLKAIEAVHRDGLAGLAGNKRFSKARVMGTIAAFDIAGEDADYAAAIGERLKSFFLDEGLVIRPLGNTIYLLPPYCIGDAELAAAYDGISRALESVK